MSVQKSEEKEVKYDLFTLPTVTETSFLKKKKKKCNICFTMIFSDDVNKTLSSSPVQLIS